jgi:hypothetical protein
MYSIVIFDEREYPLGKKHRHKYEKQRRAQHHEIPTSHLEGEMSMVYSVRIEPAPEDKDKYTEEKDSRQKLINAANRLNKISGVAAGIAFLALVAFSYYACLVRQSNTIAKAASDLAYRPYIGVDTMPVTYIEFGPKGEVSLSKNITDRTRNMIIGAEIKNFGPVPGTQFTSSWRVWIGGREQPMRRFSDAPSTLYPTETVAFKATTGETVCRSILNGTDLVTEVTVDYTGPNGRYHECVKEQFEKSGAAFLNLGACDH